ncbi:MAG: hypothetical protein ABI574_11130 [Burkholderiales bacterium]
MNAAPSASASASAPSFAGWPWPWPLTGQVPSFGFAPTQLQQPINPGWTFGNVVVNSANSSAPAVEQAVVSHHSYGRQIGRLTAALEALVQAWPEVQQQPPVQDFLALADDIRRLKQASRSQRLAGLRDELAALKSTDPAAWAELVGPP